MLAETTPMHSLGTTLEVARAHLPHLLVTQETFRRLGAAIDHLPAAVAKMLYFECRLRETASQVDLVLAVYRRGAAIVGRYKDPTREPAPDWWMRLQAFCRRWVASPSLALWVDHIWLEYDVAPDSATAGVTTIGRWHGSPEPGIFISLAKPSTSRDCRMTAWLDRVSTVVEAITCNGLARCVRRSLRICVEALPPSTVVAYIGLMTHRATPTIRVCLANVPVKSIATYVTTVTTRCPRQLDLATRLAALRYASDGEGQVSMLHLDISPEHGVLPRVGLERLFSRQSQRQGQIADTDRFMLRMLERRGLCTYDKREALLAWPGRSVAVLPHELWWSRIDRRINHLKFVLDGDACIDVKAYLLFSYLCHSGPGRAANRTALG